MTNPRRLPSRSASAAALAIAALAGVAIAGPLATPPAFAQAAGAPERAGPAGNEPDPEQERALFMARLQGLYENGADDVVVEDGEERLAKTPGDAPLRHLVARALARTAAGTANINDQRALYVRAMNHLQSARVADPERIDVRVDICNLHYIMGRLPQLLEEMASLLADRPDDETLRDLLLEFADLFIRDGRENAARDIYALVASAWPGSASVAANHGTVLLLSGRLNDGIAELTRAAGLDPADADTAHNLARAHVYAGHPDRALEWFGKARALRPEHGRFVLDLAVFTSHDSPGASKPLFVEANRILGINDVQSALVGNLASALTRTDLGAVALARLARDLDQSGYPVYAMAAIARALERNPDAIDPLVLRAGILDRQGFHAQALAAYRRARALLPSQPEATRAALAAEVVSGIARSHVGLGEGREALDVLEAAGPPEDFPFESAEALILVGDVPGAVSLLEQVARREYDPQIAEAAKKRLREITSGTRR